MKLWKRNAVVAAIVLFVCVAVYLNWSYQEEGTETGKVLGQATLVNGATTDPLLAATATPGPEGEPSAAPSDAAKTSTGYFASARLNRQQARDSALTMLQNTLTAGDTEAAMLDAGAAIETLASTTVSEAQIENLVVAKGYTDCVAFISDGGVSVVVSATENGLQDADVARITEIVTGETGVPASQITIIEAQG
ncbi:MAG: SpoIIIAH-like family protein [Oscillospiraceae bacterium]|jgi:stage III sporulation protein AH|nr:SpoIIIAH-like family protein [Oscillospiraceae bacterium]